MKITLYRASGLPIKVAHKEQMLKHLNDNMDTLEETLGICNDDNAKEYAEILDVVNKEVSILYPNKKRIQCPTSPKAIQTLCDKYGTVAFCMEDDKLVLYIMDA